MSKGILSKNPRGRTWCGPAAMTVVTGKSYDDCCAAILHSRNQHGREYVGRLTPRGFTCDRGPAFVKGTYPYEIAGGLRAMGVKLHSTPIGALGKTLARFLRERTKEERDAYIIVGLRGHWIVVKGNKAWDSCTPARGEWIRKMHSRRSRVDTVIMCSAKGRARRVS